MDRYDVLIGLIFVVGGLILPILARTQSDFFLGLGVGLGSCILSFGLYFVKPVLTYDGVGAI